MHDLRTCISIALLRMEQDNCKVTGINFLKYLRKVQSRENFFLAASIPPWKRPSGILPGMGASMSRHKDLNPDDLTDIF